MDLQNQRCTQLEYGRHVARRRRSSSIVVVVGRMCPQSMPLAMLTVKKRDAWFSIPCIRPVRMKFESTNQDSACRKNCTVLYRKTVLYNNLHTLSVLYCTVLTSNEGRATFRTGDGIEFSRKGIYNSKNHITL